MGKRDWNDYPRHPTLGSGMLHDALRLHYARDRRRAARALRWRWLLLTLVWCCACIGCETTPPPTDVADRLIVDVSKGEMVAEWEGRVVKRIPVETGRNGTGSRLNSKKTPIGEFVIYQKQQRHKFAKDGVGVLRMKCPKTHGKTVHEPGRRGVHVHRNLDGKAEGTNGCVCPLSDEDMRWVWEVVQVGTEIEIQH